MKKPRGCADDPQHPEQDREQHERRAEVAAETTRPVAISRPGTTGIMIWWVLASRRSLLA